MIHPRVLIQCRAASGTWDEEVERWLGDQVRAVGRGAACYRIGGVALAGTAPREGEWIVELPREDVPAALRLLTEMRLLGLGPILFCGWEPEPRPTAQPVPA